MRDEGWVLIERESIGVGDIHLRLHFLGACSVFTDVQQFKLFYTA